MCNAETLEEQRKIWRQEIRPHFLSTWLIRILNNERFLWGALGIPPAQMQMVLKEGELGVFICLCYGSFIWGISFFWLLV